MVGAMGSMGSVDEDKAFSLTGFGGFDGVIWTGRALTS